MLGIPKYTDAENEFNLWIRRLAPFAMLTVFGLVIVMQQFLRSVVETTLTAPPEALRVSEEVREPGIEGFVLLSKEAVKARAAGYGREAEWGELLAEVEARAASRTDRFRAALVAGELVGKDAAVKRLRDLKGELAEGSELRTDIDWALRLYRKGRGDLPGEAVDAMVARHGWFGTLALGFGAASNDPYRTQSVRGMDRILRAMTATVVFRLSALLLGIIAIAVVLTRFGREGLEGSFEPSGLHPGIYLETFTLDQFLFLVTVCFQTLTLWMTGAASIVALSVNELMIWLTVLSAAWPFLRGTRLIHVAPDLGLTAGKGVAVEAGWGVVAFLFMTPLVGLVNILVAGVAEMMGMDDGGAPAGFPTFEHPLSGSWIPVVMGMLGAVVLAPVSEEVFFRGAFYQYLRTRWGVAAGVLVSAGVFGAVHPYGGQGLIQVGCMGVVFALIREWRGSLIAGIVAHALHNGSLEFFEIWTISAINS